MKELVGELKDEGDKGAGWRAREKKMRKKEERREARERERKKIGKVCLMRKKREV